MCCMGNLKCEEGEGVDIGLNGWEGNTLVHSMQHDTNCLISLDMPGQKYSPLARLVVFVIPEWLECNKCSTGFTAGNGKTIRRESSNTKSSKMERESKDPFKCCE